MPGDSKGCTGPGACAGYQVCGGDGTYGACICGGGGAGGGFADIKSNAAATCALTTDGAVHCWGKNRRGDLGIGSADTTDHPTPERVINLPRIVAIASGVGTCALSAAGNRYCWGNNDVGFLGSGATEDIYTPRALP